MRIGIIAILIVCSMSFVCAAEAAEDAKVILDAKDTPLNQVIADIGKQSGEQIMLDSGLSGSVTGHFDSIELEKLLDAITKPNGLKWQKLYLPTLEDQKPTLEQVKARAASLDAVTGSTVVIYDSITGKQKVFVEQDAKAPSVDTAKLGLTPVYLVSKPKTDTAEKKTSDVATRFNELETERMSLLANMTSEQRQAAMQQEMQSLINLDPMTRQQILMDQMSARHNMDPAMRQQYQQMMHDTFQAMRDQGIMPDRGGRRGGQDGGDHGHGGGGGN